MSGTFLCSECPYRTENSYDLTKHGLYHSKTKNYPCTACKKLFTTASDLKRHERTHSEDKLLQCSFQNCSFVTNRSDSLSLHEITHTRLESRLNHPCPRCQKMFSSNQIVSRHLKTCGNLKMKKEKVAQETLCKICERNYSSPYKLKIHLRSHEGIKDFECSICQKKFSSNYALSKHSLTHNKQFQCSFCHIMFSRKDNLQKHMVHNHKIGNSSKSFNTASTGEKVYSVQLCEEISDEHVGQLSIDDNIQNSRIIFTSVVGSAESSESVIGSLVPSNADPQIMLLNNETNQGVLIIEDPIVYV